MSGAGYDVVVDVDDEVSSQGFSPTASFSGEQTRLSMPFLRATSVTPTSKKTTSSSTTPTSPTQPQHAKAAVAHHQVYRRR